MKDKASLVSVPPATSLDEALALMQSRNVLSLPVRSASFEEKKVVSAEDFEGIVDILDILVLVAYGNFRIDDKESSPEQVSGQKLNELKVSDLIGAERELSTGFWDNGITIVSASRNLFDTLDCFVVGERRVLVDLNESLYGSGFRVLSQLDVLQYLVAQGKSALESIASRSLSECGLLSADSFNELCIASQDTSTLSAYRKMITWKGDAVAITNASGVLVGTLSPTDLRVLWSKTSSLEKCLVSLEEFMKFLYGSFRTPVTVGPESTLFEAMERCVAAKIHRVWATDSSGKPIACIRTQDMLIKFSGADHKRKSMS